MTLKRPHRNAIQRSGPSWLVSQFVDRAVMKGCLQWGTHMCMCYFLCRIHALAGHGFALRGIASLVCCGRAPARSCATELLWNEICPLKLRPLALGSVFLIILQVWASLPLSIIYGEMWNKVFTSAELCTRGRKLKPGWTICGVIKLVFVPPWLPLCFPSLCFLLSSISLHFPPPSIILSFTICTVL